MKTQPRRSLWSLDLPIQAAEFPENFDGAIPPTSPRARVVERPRGEPELPDGRALRLTGASAAKLPQAGAPSSAPVGSKNDRALQELEPIHPGVVTCFAVVAKLGEEARGTELGDLVHRFMAQHPGLELQALSRPTSATFSVEGTREARERFTADPRWPRMQAALIDLYRAELIAVANGRPRPPRQIEDAARYVFGSA